MSAARLFILVIAAIAAIVLAFVVRGALGPKAPDAPVAAAAPAAQTTSRVLVAKRDLRAYRERLEGELAELTEQLRRDAVSRSRGALPRGRPRPRT